MKIDDRIAEQTESVITQVCKESKLWIHPNLLRPSFSFTYWFKFTYFCIVYIQTWKKEFCSRNEKPLKLQQNFVTKFQKKFVTNLHNKEALRKLHMQLKIPSCLGYGIKSFNVQGFDE